MALQEWITADKGIRYREHSTRKHGIRPDRYYTLRFRVDGKRVEEALGWASEGWTLEKARAEMVRLREAHRTGQGVTTLREARAKAKSDREQQVIQAQKKALDELTFDNFWESTYLPSAGLSKKAKSITTEKGLYAKWIQPVIGCLPLKLLSPTQLVQILQRMSDADLSARSMQYALAVVSQVWNSAHARDLVSGNNPCRKVKAPKFDNKRIRFLNKGEAKNLLDSLLERSYDTHDAALLSLLCGLRAGEIFALKWADIDMDNGQITIRDPKNSKNRHVYMQSDVKTMLIRRFSGQSRNELVFKTSDGQERHAISKSFQTSVNELGFNENIDDPRMKVVFHTLRHTFASWLVMEGTPLYTVAKLMGHSTLEMTQRYAHLSPDTKKQAIMALENVFNK